MSDQAIELHAASSGPFSAPFQDLDEIQPQLMILPFRGGRPIDILLVRGSGREGWRLPAAASLRGLTRHASAALAAHREAGVSGRIFKRPIKSRAGGAAVSIYPLLVREEMTTGGAAQRWAPLQEAVSLIDQDLRPALIAFANRAVWSIG
jgi:hypothetical protein